MRSFYPGNSDTNEDSSISFMQQPWSEDPGAIHPREKSGQSIKSNEVSRFVNDLLAAIRVLVSEAD